MKILQFKAIVFDLDGTLLNSAPKITRVLNIMRLSKGMEPIHCDFIKPMISNGVETLISNALEISTLDSKSEIVVFRNLYRQLKDSADDLFDGVDETIKTLYSKNISLSVLSNKPDELCKQILCDVGLYNYFTNIIGSSKSYPLKPNPYVLNKIINSVGFSINEVCFVGDSICDLDTASNAGVKFVFFSKGYDDGVNTDKCYKSISSPRDLISIIYSEPLIE